MAKSAASPDTHVELHESVTSYAVDGYALGEPKYLSCPYCSGWVRLTEDPSDGWQEIHDPDCRYE